MSATTGVRQTGRTVTLHWLLLWMFLPFALTTVVLVGLALRQMGGTSDHARAKDP